MKHGDEQRRRILDTGLRLWPDTSARRIGSELRMSHTNVLYHFGNADRLRNAVAAHAVACGDSRVISYLLAEKHDAVSAMPEAERMGHLLAG